MRGKQVPGQIEGVWNRQTGFGRKALTQPPALRLSSSVLPESHPVPSGLGPLLVPIEVIQAVHLILVVQGKALVPDAPGTGHTCEAGWVEGLAQGPDDVFLNHLATLATLLQGVLEQRATASEPTYARAHAKPQGLLSSSEWAQKARGSGGELKFMQLAYNYYP